MRRAWPRWCPITRSPASSGPSTTPFVTLCLQDLIHLFKKIDPSLQFKELYDLVVTDPDDAFGPYHAWAWSHDPWTGGAFALFGPSQFQNVYKSCQELFCKDTSEKQPRFHFAMAGEALSDHHVWICGAFDSAYTTLGAWLLSLGREDLLHKLKQSKFGDGEGNHVQE